MNLIVLGITLTTHAEEHVVASRREMTWRRQEEILVSDTMCIE